jgi:hypothetical protein
MLARYARVIPFEVALGNTDYDNESSVLYLKRYYLESGEMARLPGYCTALLHDLAHTATATSTSRIRTVLSGLITALSTLETHDFEDAKRRVFQSKSVIEIALNPVTNPVIQSST